MSHRFSKFSAGLILFFSLLLFSGCAQTPDSATLEPDDTTVSPDQSEDTASSSEEVTVYVVNIPEGGASMPSDVVVTGCEDSYLVPITRVVEEITGSGLKTALNELFAMKEWKVGQSGLVNPLYQSNVSVSGIEMEGESLDSVRILLEGELVSGGTCDTPRIKDQIEQTIEFNLGDFNDYEIVLNGDNKNWRCWGDQSGQCE